VYDVLLRPEGRLRFDEGVQPPEVPVELDLDLDVVLQEWGRRRQQWLAIQSKVPSLQTTFRLKERTPVVADPRLREVLVLAAAGRTVAEISLETRRSDLDVALALMDL